MTYCRFIFFLLAFGICFCIINACSDDNEIVNPNVQSGSIINDFNSPDYLKPGIYVNWWGIYFENDNQYSEAPDVAPLSIQILNNTDHQPSWSSDWGTYTYSKTGEKTAFLSFSVVENFNGHIKSFQYQMNLTFISDDSFTMTGSKRIISSMNGVTNCKLECEGVISLKRSSEGFDLPNIEDAPIIETESEIEQEGGQETMGILNGHEWTDLGLSVKWATCNVGNSSPEGDDNRKLYAWGETTRQQGLQQGDIYHSYWWTTYKWCNGTDYTISKYCTDNYYGIVDNRMTLNYSDDVATVEWGSKWRMPTFEEMKELYEKCTWTWITRNGVSGIEVKGPNNKKIFLPAEGYWEDISGCPKGSWGRYWSATLDVNDNRYAYTLDFGNNGCKLEKSYRCAGHSVRPVTE